MGLSAAVKKSINDFQIVDIDSKKEPVYAALECDVLYLGIINTMAAIYNIIFQNLKTATEKIKCGFSVLKAFLENPNPWFIQGVLIGDSSDYYSGIFSKDSECSNLQEYIDTANQKLEEVIEFSGRKEEYLILLYTDMGKSLYQIYVENIDKLIIYYCKITYKTINIMRRNIFYTAQQAIDKVRYDASVCNSIDELLNHISENVLSSKKDRIQTPFTYYLDALDE